MNIFVGNISFSATDDAIKSLFEAFGAVASVKIKRKSGENSRGFGFVTMPDELQAQAAIAGLEGKELLGRPLRVSAERPKPVKPKKDYKEIKRLRQEAKKETPVVFDAPEIPEKEIKPKVFKKPVQTDATRKKIREAEERFSQPAGAQAWEKRKGRGTAKPWKKKPGGVNKKFKYSR